MREEEGMKGHRTASDRTTQLRRFLLPLQLCVFGLVTAGQPAFGQPSPVDTTYLGFGEHARMHMLLEKTIFQVDVLFLDIRLGAPEAARLQSLLTGRKYSDELADSVAAVALDARNAWARIEFKRDVSLEQFLDGIRKNLGRAKDAGIVTPEEYEGIVASLPRWYAFLVGRQIRSGDQMIYGIRGDTLHTVFRDAEGDILLDQVDVGPQRRVAVLGGYFAPKSDFRESLVRSLFGAESQE
jgi:hypothetical protein